MKYKIGDVVRVRDNTRLNSHFVIEITSCMPDYNSYWGSLLHSEGYQTMHCVEEKDVIGLDRAGNFGAMNKCTCGSSSVGSGAHSTWCDSLHIGGGSIGNTPSATGVFCMRTGASND